MFDTKCSLVKARETGDFIAHDVFIDCSQHPNETLLITPKISGVGPGTANIRLNLSNLPADTERLYAVPYQFLDADNSGAGQIQARFSVTDDPDGQVFSAGLLSLNQTVYFVAKLVFVAGALSSVSGALL